jgi:hypothetical protein
VKFVGGPRDGETVEPEHEGADEIQVSTSDFSEDHVLLHKGEYTYLPDAFGRMVWQKPDSVQ